MSSNSPRSTRAGPQKLYSKLISKINSFPPKINKLPEKPITPITLPLQTDQRKRTSITRATVEKSDELRDKPQKLPSTGLDYNYENSFVFGLSGFDDSDMKCNNLSDYSEESGGDSTPQTATSGAHFCLDAKIDDDQRSRSLEDEIFEELERVAHDEAKLSAALENFDKILFEYTERGLKGKSREPNTATTSDHIAKQNNQSSHGFLSKEGKNSFNTIHKKVGIEPHTKPKKILHKSKTCSIIESKCILKQSSHRNTLSALNDSSPHFSNVCLARSLLNLNDLEKFVKVSSGQTTSTLMFLTSNRKIVEKSAPKNKQYNTYKVKNSAVDSNRNSSDDTALPNRHSPARRTNSGSKIPVSTTSSRSNSFILSTGSITSLPSISTAALNDCRLEPNHPNAEKMHYSISTSSICTEPLSGQFNSVKSEINLRSPKWSYRKSKQNGDDLLNRCLEKGHEILKKVEQFSCTNHDRKNQLKLTGELNLQSHVLKSSTSTTTRLNDLDEIHSRHNMREKVVAMPNECRYSSTINITKKATSNNRRDNISSSSSNKSFETENNRLKPNDDGSIQGQTKNHTPKLVVTTSCQTSPFGVNNTPNNRARKHQQSSNVIVNVNEKATNSSATQTKPASFETKSAPTVSVSSREANRPPKMSKSFVELNNNSVKSKNIVKKCVSNFESQCRPIDDSKKTKRKNGNSINLASAGSAMAGGNKLPNWKKSSSSISVLTLAPPLVSPALVKQNKGTCAPDNNNRLSYSPEAMQTQSIMVHPSETTISLNPTLILVPACPLPPAEELEERCSEKIRSSHVYNNRDSNEKNGEEVYDGEEKRVIDHLKCVNKINPTEKEETYQSDYSDDSGHISNENIDHEENLKLIPGKLTNSLLQIFEQNYKSEAVQCVEINGSNFRELCNDSSDYSSDRVNVSGPKKLSNGSGSEAIRQAKVVDGSGGVSNDKHDAILCADLEYQCNTEVLFRSGVLNQLEAKRDELLSDRIIQLQAYCRGHLARKRLTQRRVQELAVKCIQRNVRAFLKVREWPWWRLLVRVTPLLNVHRTEEQLKIATTELQILKAKLEKVESERNSLKGENTKLESRLSEMTAELSEEHSSSNLISERLEAETTERLRLEKEVKEHEAKYRNLQESSEKLEMELICAKSDLNGDLDDDLEGDENGSSAYRMKYERVARELEFTKKRLQTQHEHDLEQLIGLKKQLEKKLADAYEEVEEQRQVVGQWKRKAQKMTNEMNDLRMLLEEQNSRNNLLEKRQRKFDSECQALQDSARQEKQAKERLTREKDVLIAEKFTIEQSLSDVRLELELKEEKYSALQRELEEMTFGGGTEEEIAQLKRQKMELDRRCKEQEEELDEMAGQIQLLEQAKLRLEMSLETMRKDSRKEAQQRDDELEEVRGSSYKKIKSLECQLEQEHEERTLLLREKHELERRLNNLEDQDRADRAAEEHASQKLKRDLRKYKALLRDAQSQLERVKTDSAGKTLIRQLRNQLEDAESARSAAVKARQVAENDLQDVQSMLEEAQRARFDAEDKATAAQRDRTELQAQIDENDEEMAELIKKYSTTVKQLSSEQAIIADYEIKISELETEKKSLKEQISDLTSRLENVENISDSSSSIQLKRLELRTKELESRLEFEQATRARMEIQLNRHKDSIEKAQSEMNQTRNKEIHAQEALKKAQKTIRELREELHSITNKEHESVVKRKDLEKRLESVEAEAASARADLRLALQRIADLQQAMEEGDSYHSDSENSDSSIDSMSELNYCRSSNNSSLRARSGEVNGTSSNGGSTTLCIREEKENTPRIRSKFKGTCLRRRRLPFTIKEEEEEDEVSLDSLHASVEPRERKTIKDDDDDTIGNCIESIRKALIDGAMQSNTELRVPPKHTGAIKKIFQVQSKSNESNLAEEHEGVNIPNNRTDAHCNPTDNLSDSNKQFTSESSTDTDTRKPTNSTEHCSNDDSRFDFEALKSIKEKIKNLNRNLKEEAMQEACSKTDCSNLTARMQSFELSKNESPNTRMSSFDKLDQIDSQLNLDGIRLMKEKIQKMKKKLQEESSSVTKSLSTEEITGEINEMKKTLTAAFISKNVEKDALRQSSSREECSSSMDHNSSSSSIASSIFAPTSSSATLSNLRTKASAADSENIFEKSGSITTTPSNEGGVNANYVNDAADNNNDLLECLPQCSNPIQLAAVLMNAENLPIVSVDTFQKISIATNIAKTEDEEYNVSSSLESEVLVMDNNPELRSSCEMQEYIPLEKDRNTTETIVDQQCNDNDKDSVCEKIESQDETQKVNLEKNATFFPNKYDIQTAYDENLQSEADTAHLEIDENSGNSSQILNKDPECLITEQQEDLCPAPDSADEKPCLLEEFPSRQTSEDISQVCTNSDVQEVNKVSTTCLRNICENTAMCRCENIDQIVIMLTNSMEKVERLPSNFQNKLGNDENNNSNNEKVFLQTGAPGITTNGKYNQDDTDQANVENSVCTEKLEHEKDTKAFMSMPDVYCTIETKIHAQLVSSNEIEEEVNHFKTDNNNETNSQEKVTTGEQNLTKKAFSQFIERCNQDNSDQTKVEDSVCTENLENVLLIVEKDTEVFMLMPGDDSTFKTKNHDQSSQLVSSNEVKEEIKIDNNNNNETSSPEKVTTGEQILTKKVFSNHGSLKRKPKQMDLPDSSIPSPRRSSLQNSSSTKTIYSDLAKGNTLKTAQVSSQLQNAETVDSSLNVTKPIDNITNHVSERTSLVDRTDLLTERSSSCSIVPLYAVAVSIDVTNSNVPSAVGVELPTTDQQKPLTYAESLRKARTPPKTQGVPVRVPSVGTIASRTNATRNGKQQIQQQNQQQRVRHLSLARGGNNQKQASDTIRQSKSASRLSTKPSNSKQTCAKPSVSLSPAPNNACLRRNNTLGAQNLNKSSSNLLQERKQNENTIKSTSKQSKEQINHANSRNRNSTRK
ncbi:uncharacterized protein LOC129770721 isoform X5 [Toxorhynchites rutilus septentrionalis]|uniref:uncharacterized protein LOC129770721 isoform X5 n=1 Tax=Toxorhynchites rutilus septentrionalis TaxID=329112 RepID=UPI00247AA321|nr:uncharacterized protein LOC129770721 isoform X5 [Toxorhynchites rutilus septentrionalis]